MTLATDLVEVRLVGVPVALSGRAAEHFAELQREFVLIAESDGLRERVPARLLDLVDRATREYAAFSEAQEQQLADAADAGEDAVDLLFQVPPGVAEVARELDALLDEADDFCRTGDLLTLETPADCVAYRKWYLGQFVRQVEGAPAVAWGDWTGRSA